MNTYNQRLGCFLNSVIVLINLPLFAIVRFSESLIWVQTELDSTQSF